MHAGLNSQRTQVRILFQQLKCGMEWTVERIRKLIEENTLYKFYKSKAWKKLREEILKKNHYECEWCRKKGKIVKAETVHHIQYVKKHPDLALSEYYEYKGKKYKNLVALCHDCHDKAHKRMQYKKKIQINEERW